MQGLLRRASIVHNEDNRPRDPSIMAHGLSTTDVPLFAALGIWIFNVGMLVLMVTFM